MSLMRVFTNRRNKPDVSINAPVGGPISQRGGKSVLRMQISSPIALVSTSNMLSYNAPDINGTTPIAHREFSSSSSTDSSLGEESDASTANSIHSHDTVATDMSSVDTASPVSPEPNHLSCYFKPAVETSAHTSPVHSPRLSAASSFHSPTIPQRAPSHSKRAHESLSRKRSMNLQAPLSIRSSTEILSPTRSDFLEAPRENPFGSELAQLDEVAEEFGSTVRIVEDNADASYMKAHDLAAFNLSDYLIEIRSLLDELYSPEPEQVGAWF